jgi:pentatricopeptide repeat protein
VIRRGWYCILLLAVPASLFVGQWCLGAEEAERKMTSSSVLAFADHLFEDSDYHRAISEYKRFIYLFPREPRVLQARFKMGVSYQKSGYLDNAVEVFQKMQAYRLSPDVKHAVRYEIGKCYFLGRDYARSSEVLRALGSDRSLALAGWAHLRARNYRDASECFALACEAEPDGYLEDLCSSLSRESLAGESIPRKNTKAAALLSVPVPGAGRVYCGRLGDGLFSFLLVTASYAGAYSYYEDEDYAVSLGLLAFGLLFHGGDVYGAFNSARLYNATGEEAFIRGIEDHHNLGPILLD